MVPGGCFWEAGDVAHALILVHNYTSSWILFPGVGSGEVLDQRSSVD
jgi:hypothetical protein